LLQFSIKLIFQIMAKTYKTPGVYIEEKNAFPSSIVAVATSIPAFVGYTEKAAQGMKSLANNPTRVSSWAEFAQYFGDSPTTQYEVKSDGSLTTVTATRYLLADSLRLFFANGGGACYVVSVGNYSDPASAEHLTAGIDTLSDETEPSMLVVPDAMLLSEADCAVVQQKMLAHCGTMRLRFAILDVFMSENALNAPNTDAIAAAFRAQIGTESLSWGAAYYPWLRTSIHGEATLANVSPDAYEALRELLTTDTNDRVAKGSLNAQQAAQLQTLIGQIKDNVGATKAAQPLHQALLAASPGYKSLIERILGKMNLLPPSAAIAGVYAVTDNSYGVFKAPANVSLAAVLGPVVNLTDDQQADLNVSPMDGKSIDAIRAFLGRGTVVWGARTLDGNSNDWRYVNVQRMAICLEQSIKLALQAYVFASNDANTWLIVRGMVESFLTGFWQQGGLQGATPREAFSVQVGLGSTMTPVDIEEGYMIVQVLFAMVRPSEFIALSFKQKMEGIG
jgi:hypothetical protein